MSSVTGYLSGHEMLRALDPDLPFLASQAAVELDNLLLGNASGLDCVKLLAERLRNASQIEGMESRQALMDLPTVEVFSSALFASHQGHQVRTLGELISEAWRIAGVLSGTGKDQDRKLIEDMRSFCVALSRCASSYRHSVYDLGQMEPSWR